MATSASQMPPEVFSLWKGVIRPRRVSMTVIAARVAERYGLRPDDILGRNRDLELSPARSEFCKLAHDAGHSNAAIGRKMSGRDHSCANHYRRIFEGIA